MTARDARVDNAMLFPGYGGDVYGEDAYYNGFTGFLGQPGHPLSPWEEDSIETEKGA